MNAMLCRIAMLSLLLVLAGCASTRGAPKPAYSPDLTKAVIADTQLKALLEQNNLKPQRNALIFQALAVVDIRYSEFQQRLMNDKTHTSSITDALVLGMTIAGSLTPSAGVKENWLQGIALVTGGMSIYDKNYLHSQTIAALVAQMDANRKKKRAQLLELMQQDSIIYPGAAAFNDILEYYQAGTVLGALMGIQVDAEATTKKEEESIKKTMEQLQVSTMAMPLVTPEN